uniref:NADH-ubiquinone oxidoreductase chain 2 n=1 Tax=Phrynoglossus myanhessei TaxID=2798809 RepID=A0A8A0WTA9_9NEOB|nr:NADH dehydrogenase subunit 2 [Phrynoglossus myanhessei]QSQ72192.1 NADH dehydrogenase subunit 2 [Phrynoglossus myanhessei]
MITMSLIIGTLTTLSSNHWLLAWVGLEISTLAIIPLMIIPHHPRSTEATTKYFLTQAVASATILFSSTMNAWKTGQWNLFTSSNPFSTITALALMTKLGLAPMHFWLPEVLQGIPLTTGLILSTWQKIAPMAILVQISESINMFILFMVGTISAYIGGWGGINQTQLRKIMAFSSISHLGWMITILKLNPHLTLYNLVIYIMMTTAMFLSLSSLFLTKTIQMATFWSYSPTLAAAFLLVIFSLTGLPPLLGFSPKLLIVMELTKQDTSFLATLLLLSSLLTTFFYLRLTFISTLIISPNTQYSSIIWRVSLQTNIWVPIFIMLSTMTFILTPTFYYLQ